MEIDDPYTRALEMLAAGAMPIIVVVGGDLHVVSVVPSSKDTLACMISDDERTRGHFVASAIKSVKERIEEVV